MTQPYLLQSAAATHRGERAVNQDTVLHRSDCDGDGLGTGLYVVCDGFGPGQTGKQASALAAETIGQHLASYLTGRSHNGRSQNGRDIPRAIGQAVAAANEAVLALAQSSPEEGHMGTTLALALVRRGQATIANVGDSRTYAWRRGRLSRLTEDHSLPGQLAAHGLISEQQMLNHPYLNILDRALGTRPEVKFDLFDWPLQAGDRLLLCTDGLWKSFEDAADLGRLLAAGGPPDESCRSLVAEAGRRGARDNISAVLVEAQPVAADLSRHGQKARVEIA